MWKWRQKPEIKHNDSKDKRLCRALKGCEALAKKGRFTDAMTELNMGMTAKVKVEQVMQLLEKHPRSPGGNTYLEHDAPPGIELDKKILKDIALHPPPRKGTSTNGCRLEHLANAAKYGDIDLLHKACCAQCCTDTLISFLRTLSLGQLSRRAQDSGNKPPRDSFGHLEDDDWVHGNRSRDFEPLSDAEAKSLEFTWRSLLKWLWLSLDPSVQSGCRYQYNPHSGSLAQCSVRSENRVMLTSIQNDPHSPRKRAPDDSLKLNCEIPDGMESGVVAAAMSEPPEVQSQTLRL